MNGITMASSAWMLRSTPDARACPSSPPIASAKSAKNVPVRFA
jgi:hypothetical protein